MATTPAEQPTVPGVPDTRTTPLHLLAGDQRGAVDALRHVLPADEGGRVAVAAFGSSI